MKIKIAIASGKGGAGKSMLASSLTLLFTQDKKVVAVDCDVDAPNLHLWLGQKESWGQVEKISTNERSTIDPKRCNLCGRCVDICAFGALKVENCKLKIVNFYCEGCGACEVVCPQKAIKMKPVKNAEIRVKKIRLRQGLGGQSVFGFPLVSAQLYPGETGSGKIVEEIKKRAENFDHQMMILDSPAGTGCPVIAVLKDADFAVLVTEPTPSGLTDLKRVLTVANHFQIPYGLVINKWDINQSLSKKIEKEFRGKILGKISYDQRIFQAIAKLTPIMETNLRAKNEIKKIWKSLTRKVRII